MASLEDMLEKATLGGMAVVDDASEADVEQRYVKAMAEAEEFSKVCS